jgi:hypothetical protein
MLSEADMIDPATFQPGDKLTLEVEFARTGDGRLIVVTHGAWVAFPVPLSAVTGHRPAKEPE